MALNAAQGANTEADTPDDSDTPASSAAPTAINWSALKQIPFQEQLAALIQQNQARLEAGQAAATQEAQQTQAASAEADKQSEQNQEGENNEDPLTQLVAGIKGKDEGDEETPEKETPEAPETPDTPEYSINNSVDLPEGETYDQDPNGYGENLDKWLAAQATPKATSNYANDAPPDPGDYFGPDQDNDKEQFVADMAQWRLRHPNIPVSTIEGGEVSSDVPTTVGQGATPQPFGGLAQNGPVQSPTVSPVSSPTVSLGASNVESGGAPATPTKVTPVTPKPAEKAPAGPVPIKDFASAPTHAIERMNAFVDAHKSEGPEVVDEDEVNDSTPPDPADYSDDPKSEAFENGMSLNKYAANLSAWLVKHGYRKK